MQTITDDVEFLQFLGELESQYFLTPSEIGKLQDEETVKPVRYGTLPFSKTHSKIRFLPGETSIWGGHNGHGKTQLLTQLAAWSLHESRWLIASLEMKPIRLMDRMLRQVSGTNDYSKEFRDKFQTWSDGRLWIYDQTGSVAYDRILGMIHYAAKKMDVNNFIVDSLMKCGINESDRDGEKDFMDKLCWAAKRNDVHIHLVHHMRKGADEYTMSDKADFMGSGYLTHMADNVFIMFRNKKKEDKRQTGKEVDENEPDCILACRKQRNGEWEGLIYLWYHKASMQYIPRSDNRIMFYRGMT